MKPASDTRKPYGGQTRSLVIALDVGTTFSGVSYAILEPGEVPKIHGVTRFPGQEHVAGNSKIPSVMYYDKRGIMQAAGAEAETASVQSQAEDEGWIKAELFKLRMRPKTMKLQMNGMRLSPLPRGKSSVDVFGEFLSYLFRCTRNFITDTHANGPALWNDVQDNMQFVLSHPNGWEGAQQTKMRRAAVYGGLIPDTDEGKARIRFVTEGEASLHACVLNGLANDVLSNPSRHGFLVADAGGGTLDISSYAIRGTVPLVIEEIAPPDCVFSGSVFVSRRARAFLQDKLKNSKYGTPDSVDHITKRFDETTKRLFRDAKDLQFIPFGSPLDKDMSVGIRGGQLKLTGAEVAELFEPSINAAVASIRAQIEASQGVVRSVWLVGGFAASPWLFSQLQERLAPLKVTVSRPDTQTSKAVADGAIGFYCDHHVSARMSKFMYGVEFLREFDSRDPEHISRRNRLCELPSGPKLLPDAFDCILSRSVKVKESTVFSRKYCTELTSLSTLSVFEVEIWCYRGGDTIPPWILRQAEEFSTLCVVRADLSPLSGSAQPKQSRSGKSYWTIVFSVEIHFGLTEFKARIKWVDNGRTRYGPASIIYNESGSRGDEDEPESGPEDDLTHAAQSRITSRGHSPASYASGGPSNRLGSAVEFPRAESVIGTPSIPSIETTRGFERERTGSRGLSFSSTAPPPEVDVRGRSRRGSERAMDPPTFTARDKGKERERIPSGVSDWGAPPVSRTISATSKLGETLNDTWGSITKGVSPLASPIVESVRPSQPPSVKPETPKVATPKEKTREPSILGDRVQAQAPAPAPIPEEPAQPFTMTHPSQIDTQLLTPANPEPPTAAFEFGDSNNTSWGFDPASAPGPANELEPQSPVDTKKKKGAKTSSKLGSKAASTAPTKAPTPSAKTPKERSPKNDWATLNTTAIADPVAEPKPEEHNYDWAARAVSSEPIVEVPEITNSTQEAVSSSNAYDDTNGLGTGMPEAENTSPTEASGFKAAGDTNEYLPYRFGASSSGSANRVGAAGRACGLDLNNWSSSITGFGPDGWGLNRSSDAGGAWPTNDFLSTEKDTTDKTLDPASAAVDLHPVLLDTEINTQESPYLAAPPSNVDAGNSSHTSVHGTPNPLPSPGPILETVADTENVAPGTEQPFATALAPVENPVVGEGVKDEKQEDESESPTKPLTKAQKKAKEKAEGEAKEKAEWDMLDADDIALNGDETQDNNKEDNLGTTGKPLTKAQKKKAEKERERAEKEKEKAEKETKEGAGWEAVGAADGTPLEGDEMQDEANKWEGEPPSGKKKTKKQEAKEAKEAKEKAEKELLLKDLDGDENQVDSPVAEGNGEDGEGGPSEEKKDDWGGVAVKKGKKKKGKK